MTIIIDILTTPFVGEIRKENILPITRTKRGDFRLLQSKYVTSIQINDPTLERDVIVLLKSYLKSDGIIDVTANVPIILYSLFKGFPETDDEIEDSKSDSLLQMCLALKILRLAHIYKVKNALHRMIDKLSEFFQWKKYVLANILHWSQTSYKFLVCTHYLACGWILIQ